MKRRTVFILLVVLALFYFSRHVEGFAYHDPVLAELHEKMQVLDPKLSKVTVSRGSKSYTIDKRDIYICTKDEDDKYYENNMLAYVLCHEYAHVLCDEYDPNNEHTPKFFSIFEKLLKRAEKQGFYNPNIPLVKQYCGHD